jgi:hypothetical protein
MDTAAVLTIAAAGVEIRRIFSVGQVDDPENHNVICSSCGGCAGEKVQSIAVFLQLLHENGAAAAAPATATPGPASKPSPGPGSTPAFSSKNEKGAGNCFSKRCKQIGREIL